MFSCLLLNDKIIFVNLNICLIPYGTLVFTCAYCFWAIMIYEFFLTVYLYVLYGSRNKQRLFPCIKLTGWLS